jgi:ST7 protein.
MWTKNLCIVQHLLAILNLLFLLVSEYDFSCATVFHEVSVYPKKELPFFILFTAGLCSFTALLALLTHQYPEPMGMVAKAVSIWQIGSVDSEICVWCSLSLKLFSC